MKLFDNVKNTIEQTADIIKIKLDENGGKWAVYGGTAALVIGGIILAKEATKLDELKKANAAKMEEIKIAPTSFTVTNEDGTTSVVSYTEENRKKDLQIQWLKSQWTYVKLFSVPTILMGIGIAGNLYGINTTFNKLQNTSAALSMSYELYNAYRKRVAAAIGTEKEENLFYDKVPESIRNENGEMIKIPSSADYTRLKRNPYIIEFGPVLPTGGCNNEFDEHAPASNLCRVNRLEEALQTELELKGYVFVREVYERLGMECPAELLTYGWAIERRPDGSVFSPLGGDGHIDLRIIPFHDYMCKFDIENEGSEYTIADPIMIDPNVDGDLKKYLYEKQTSRMRLFNK